MGFWDKVKGFFKKIGTGIKTVFQKVAPVVKTVLPFLAPIIPGGPATTTLITKGIDIGDKLLGGTNASVPSPAEVNARVAQGRGFMEDMARRITSKANVALDSPRIKLKL